MKRQANRLAATITNIDRVKEAYETAEGAAGSAQKEQENYEKSIQYSIDRTKALGQELAHDFLDAQAVKDIVELFNSFLEILDKIIEHPLLSGSIAAAGGGIFAILKNVDEINKLARLSDDFEKLSVVWDVLNQNIDIGNIEGVADGLEDVLKITEALDQEDAIRLMQMKGIDAELIVEILGLEGEAAASVMAAGATNTLTLSLSNLAKALIFATKELLIFLATNPVGWAILAAGAIAGLAIAYDKLTISQEEAIEKADEAISKISDTESEIKGLNTELENLRNRIKEINEQGSISITDEQELERLGKQVDLLEAQIEAKERLKEVQELTAASEAKRALTTKENPIAEEDIISRTQFDYTKINDTYDKIAELREEQKKYKADSKEFNKIEDQIQKYALDISELTDIVSENYDKILEYQATFYDEEGNLRKGFEREDARVRYLTDVITGWRNASGEVELFNKIVDRGIGNVEYLEKRMAELGKGGNVDLLDRPTIGSQMLKDQGWEETGEGTATVFSSTFSNEAGNIAMNFTPIFRRPNGQVDVLTPEELQIYAEEVIAGVRTDDLGLKIGATFSGDDAIAQAEAAAQQIHALQEDYYLDTSKKTREEQIAELEKFTKNFSQQEKDAFNEATKGAKSSEQAIRMYNKACYETIAALYEIKEGAKTAFEPSTISGAIDNLDRKVSSQLDALGSVYNDIFNGDDGFSLDVETVGMDDLNSIRDSFIDLGEDIGFTFEDAEKHVDDFLKVISNSESISDDVQKAFNKLATEYLNAAGALDDLNEETKESVIRGLESKGVTNARTVVEAQLEGQEVATAVATDVASGAVARQVGDMINDAAATDQARLAAANFLLEQIKINENKLDFSTNIAQIQSIASAYLDGAAAASIFNQTMAAKNLFKAGGAYALLSDEDKAAMEEKLTSNIAERTRQKIQEQFAVVEPYEFKSPSGGSSKSSGGGGGGGGGGSDKSSEKEKDRFKETYDWIEKRIAHLQRAIDKFGQKASGVWRTWTERNKALNSEIDTTRKLIKANTKAAERYKKAANSVVKTASGKTVGKNALNSKLEENDNGKVKRVKLAKGQHYYVNDQGQKQAMTNKQYKEYERIIKLIKSGKIGKNDIEDITDEVVANAVKISEEYISKWQEAKAAIIDAQDQLAQELQQKFDNLVQKYDQKFAKLEYRSNILSEHISQFEALGLEATQTHINQNKELVQSEKATLEKEIDALRRERDRQVANGAIKEGSEQWENYNDKIRECKVSLEQCNTEMTELNKQSRELANQRFDYLIGKINNLADESQFIVDTLSRQQLIKSVDQYTTNQLKNNHSNFKGIGQLTDAGMATLGQYGIQYNVYAEELVKLNKKRNELVAEINKEPWNSDLVDELDELDAKTRQTSQSMQGAIQSIIDLIKQGVEEEIKGLQKLTDLYSSSLDAQKELYDYNKSIKEQTTDITSLQKQLSAYRGDNSVENQARLQTLNKQLIDAQKKLEETETEHLINEQKKMLDNLVTEYSDILNAKFNDTDAVLVEAIEMINENAATVSRESWKASEANGVAITSAMAEIIPDARDTWVNDEALVATYGPKDFNVDFKADASNKLATAATNISKLAGEESAVTRAVDGVTKTIQSRIDFAEKLAQTTNGKLDSILDAINNLKGNADLISLNDELIHQASEFERNKAGGNTDAAALNSIRIMQILNDLAPYLTSTSGGGRTYSNKTGTINLDSGTWDWIQGILNGASSGSYSNSDNTSGGNSASSTPKTYDASTKQQIDNLTAEINALQQEMKEHQQAKNKTKNKDEQALHAIYITQLQQEIAEKTQERKQLRGYATGVHNLKDDELAWTQEKGSEAIVRKRDGAVLTPLKKGDSVLTAAQTENLYSIAKIPVSEIMSNLTKAGISGAVSNVNTSTTIGDISLNVSLPNCMDYASFKEQLKADRSMDKYLKSVTVDPIFGASRMKKFNS